MKFSLNWLGEFVSVKDFPENPEILMSALTEKGLEAEGREDFPIKNVIAGEIKSIKKHPNADRLTLCEVWTGKDTLPVVCGAKNHREGDRVALVLPGAVLPGNVRVKKTRIRGEESCGFLASAKELGLEARSDGVLILPPDSAPGTPFVSLSQGRGADDVVIEVNVTPNRADCLSHLGLAREISSLFRRPFTDKKEEPKPDKKTLCRLSLKVKDTLSCPRYCGRWISGVTIQPSPHWLRMRLNRMGLKSINNIVDVTNYILMERGQPLHAFDGDKIFPPSLIVALSKKNEKFTALDERELCLTGEELTIRDGKGPLALAGVIGGLSSAVSHKTKNIFLESACFRPESVRKTARRFGLETESSYRFSRGVDPTAVREALDQACVLIQRLAGGRVSQNVYDEYPRPFQPKKISLSLFDVESRLGLKADPREIKDCLVRLKCQVSSDASSPDRFEVLPPPFRVDLSLKEDLIEEFARLKGYDQISQPPPRPARELKNSNKEFFRDRAVSKVMESHGWRQVVNYSFSDPDFYDPFIKDRDKFTGLSFQEVFSVSNPISSQLSLMKPLLIPGLIQVAVNNFRRSNKQGRIFETAPVFYRSRKNYEQRSHVGLACWGSPPDFRSQPPVPGVFHIKSALEFLLRRFRGEGWTWKPLSDPPFCFHPAQALSLWAQDRPVGLIGSVHPSLKQKYKMPVDMAFGEFDVGAFWKLQPVQFKSFSELPSVERDLCFVIPLDVPAGEVREAIHRILGPVCDEVVIFDIYEGTGPPGASGKERSVSFRMFLTPEKRAWTDSELNALQEKVIQGITKSFPSVRLK